jgi:DUF177 domain-containing protein
MLEKETCREQIMIKISIPLLRKEELNLHGEEPASFINIGDDPVMQVASPVEYRLNAKLTGGSVLVTGKMSCDLKCTCGRCLEEFTAPFKTGNMYLYFDDIEEGLELDISDDLRQEAMLALPLSPLCSNDCKGLCPECGIDLNRETCSCAPDPRDDEDEDNPWSALDDLKL